MSQTIQLSYPRQAFYRSPIRLVGYILGALVLLLGCYLMWIDIHHSLFKRTMGVFGGIFFGSAAIVCLKQLLFRSPFLVIDEHGILNCASVVSNQIIEWHTIEQFSTYSIKGHTYIAIHLHKPNDFALYQRGWKKWITSLNNTLGYGTESIGVNASQYKAEEILAILEDYHQHFSGSLKTKNKTRKN